MVRSRRILSGAVGLVLVILASLVLDRLNVKLGPWWALGCLAFELFMLRLPDITRRTARGR